MKRRLLYIGLILMVMMLAGCGKRHLSGTYTDDYGGQLKFRFYSNGTCEIPVFCLLLGKNHHGWPLLKCNYQIVDGNIIKFSAPKSEISGSEQEKVRDRWLSGGFGNATLSSDWKSLRYGKFTATKQ